MPLERHQPQAGRRGRAYGAKNHGGKEERKLVAEGWQTGPTSPQKRRNPVGWGDPASETSWLVFGALGAPFPAISAFGCETLQICDARPVGGLSG
jgi:hypothetical protein